MNSLIKLFEEIIKKGSMSLYISDVNDETKEGIEGFNNLIKLMEIEKERGLIQSCITHSQSMHPRYEYDVVIVEANYYTEVEYNRIKKEKTLPFENSGLYDKNKVEQWCLNYMSNNK